MKSNCKINLGLNIVERRPDGYHNIQTVFYPIPLYDELTVEEATEDKLWMDGFPIEGEVEKNLVMKVLMLLRKEGYEIPPVCVRLRKNIPMGAGLGGGSGDAACMMKMLNTQFQLHLSDEEMERLIAPLGADCAVFIKNRPVYAEGIGNVFTPIQLDLKGWHLVVVKPDDFISTREAYAAVSPHYPDVSLLEVVQEPVARWRGRMVNDFEESVFPSHPVVEGIRDALYRMGAVYASMSGSGSSVYGLFEEKADLGNCFDSHFVFQCQL